MRWYTAGVIGAAAWLILALGCAQLAEMSGYNEAAIPADAAVESAIHTDESWKALAVHKPLGNVNARSDVKQRWASPNYGTRDWLPAAVGGGLDGNDWPEFAGSKWVWYPESEFTFGAANSIPSNRHVVHFRREFYNEAAVGDLEDTYLDVMTSGNISLRVFVNGSQLRIDMGEGDTSEETMRRLQRRLGTARPGRLGTTIAHDGTPDMQLRRYGFGEHIVYGRNVIGIQATTHLENNVGGSPVPNYVRDGIIAKVTIE